MTDKTAIAFVCCQLRNALDAASSTNGLVSAKLHRLRAMLDTALDGTRKAFDEIAERHASGPVIDGRHFSLTRTPAYPIQNEAAFNAETAPVLSESLALSFIPLTAADLGWISTTKDIGDALDFFTVVDLESA